MALLLCIETSTKVCSVAIGNNDELLVYKEMNSGEFSHAENLNYFIEACLNDSKISFDQLDAVAISEGPGSYTGLRIGTSTAKGICYAKDIPLIGVSTLQAMSYGALELTKAEYLAPMIDARRMEVFNAIYDRQLDVVKEISADVLDSKSYKAFMNVPIAFFGDGAVKWQGLAEPHDHVFFIDVLPSARHMISLAYKKFKKQDFVDLAYFEPFYLKDFIAGKPKHS